MLHPAQFELAVKEAYDRRLREAEAERQVSKLHAAHALRHLLSLVSMLISRGL